jgi:hypothetical protein
VNLELSDEQQMLVEAVDELLAHESAETLWPSLVTFGALDVASLAAVDLVLVARALGRELAAAPFVDSAAAHFALRDALPVGTSVGVCSATPAVSFERGSVTGDAGGVSFARSVDVLVVAAPEGGAIVARNADGVSFSDELTLDPALQPARVRFEGVPFDPVEIAPVLTALGGILASSDAVGAASAVLELALEYAAQRRQFGHSIGSFQAIRHLLADMHVQVESSWSSVLYAAASLDEDEPGAVRTASIAKAYSARATREVAEGALQVFGGIGFTAEHTAHRFLRRIIVRGEQFGTVAEHERALGSSLASALALPA